MYNVCIRQGQSGIDTHTHMHRYAHSRQRQRERQRAVRDRERDRELCGRLRTRPCHALEVLIRQKPLRFNRHVLEQALLVVLVASLLTVLPLLFSLSIRTRRRVTISPRPSPLLLASHVCIITHVMSHVCLMSCLMSASLLMSCLMSCLMSASLLMSCLMSASCLLVMPHVCILIMSCLHN